MTPTQIKYLKLLGYEDTTEDGAILHHREMGADGYIWRGEKFEDVIRQFAAKFAELILKNARNESLMSCERLRNRLIGLMRIG